MASEAAKELARKQKAQRQAEKERKRTSNDPNDWGRWRQFTEAYKRTDEVDPTTKWWMLGAALGVAAIILVIGFLLNMAWWAFVPLAIMSALLASLMVLAVPFTRHFERRWANLARTALPSATLLTLFRRDRARLWRFALLVPVVWLGGYAVMAEAAILR